MKKLPKLYKNEGMNTIDHNKKVVHLNQEEQITSKEEIINSIFEGFNHPYNIKVNIKTKEKEYNTYLISRKEDKIFTLDNEVIPIQDILSIQKVK